MTGRILNRRMLREQADQAEQLDSAATDSTATGSAAAVILPMKRAKAKTASAPKVRKPRKLKSPPRLRARWGVFDAGMKQVAIFDYSQRAEADEKLADLLAKKKTTHFLQIVKDTMPEPEAVVTPAV
jgi:hypothetical protein